jgi:short-subunit dehydrogenase
LDNTTLEEIDRLMQVNLMGELYGVKAVLPHMKRQGYGTIINNASIVAQRALPYLAVYSASKHGVKGFTEALRVELKRDYEDIHVVLVLPSSVNTPLFNHALSKLGVKPRPISRTYEPEIAARAIVNAAVHPQRDLYIGGAGWLFTILQHLSPGLLDRYMLMGERMFKQQQSDQPDNGRTNLFEPFSGPGRVRGDFGKKASSLSVFTRFFERMPGRVLVPVVAAAMGLVMYLTRR